MNNFIRNIFIGIVSLIIVAFILNIMPGYERDKYEGEIQLVIGENNVTENLKNSVYINENGIIYLSKDDIKQFFDENIYYDDVNNQIITTSDVKVAKMKFNNKTIQINDKTEELIGSLIKINEQLYIPISELGEVYNIETKYIEETKIVVIDRLDEGAIKATVTENVDMKYKARKLSKTILTINKVTKVDCFYTTSKGWRQIRTEEGQVGYIKANMLENEVIIRQDIEKKSEALDISINYEEVNNINEKEVIFKDLFAKYEPTEKEVWGIIDDSSFGTQFSQNLENYETRSTAINTIVDTVKEKEVKGIQIDISEVENNEMLLRFIIELAPRLREMGVATSVKLNDLERDSIKNVVDYIVSE